MGYAVETTGRLLVPADSEGAAFDAVSAAMAERDGWYDPGDESWPVTSVADLATVAGASVQRDGDWLVLVTDEEGDPKWSDQATAFYTELAPWVSEGDVVLSGEDGTEWRYIFTNGLVVQSGINGWDGSSEPFGAAADADDVLPAPATGPSPARRGWLRRR